MSKCLLTFAHMAIIILSIASDVDCDRPIYNIANMVNSVKQIDTWLGYGANALEVDVRFKWNGTPQYFYQGWPCDVGRFCHRWSYVRNYINALRQRTIPSSGKFNKNLVLVMFDVKLKKLKGKTLTSAGKKFVSRILIPLYKNNPTDMKVVVSVPNLGKKNFISGLLKQLKTDNQDIIKKIGFDISWDGRSSAAKERVLRQLGVPSGHAWLSTGGINWFPFFYLRKLKKQVQYSEETGYFSKVIVRSVDFTSVAKKYLEIDLDGMVSNYPGRVMKAMEKVNKGKVKVRLANLCDDPFAKY
ncbi:dermonecrotic toxin-like [Xenia sp. Carnegie-2017]|uniref:dermonecrotic toxin-like n=1 Tax=Xenia sp. Carnegie-2017 TaxID=2897299 RepID=UPI001F043E13|nr:dermonecrotic toxin-like [Xenia sp. Carnegie-2017]